MLALRSISRSPLLKQSLTRQPALMVSKRTYTHENATYHRDPETGIAYNDQGYQVCLNDADIERAWPAVHAKIHMHKQQAFDHVNMMDQGHYSNSGRGTVWFTMIGFTVFLMQNVSQILKGEWD